MLRFLSKLVLDCWHYKGGERERERERDTGRERERETVQRASDSKTDKIERVQGRVSGRLGQRGMKEKSDEYGEPDRFPGIRY